MNSRERLKRHLRGESVDRLPAVGGWVLGVRNLAELAGISVEDYLRDPLGGVIRANRALGVDAIIAQPNIPTEVEAIRDGALEESHFAGVEPEVLLERAQKIPDDESALLAASFDPAVEERNFRATLDPLLARLDGLALIANFWNTVARFSLYFEYGYEAYLLAIALYPEAVERIYWETSVLARERNKILLRLMKEYDLPPLLFCGNDICDNSGPLCSPVFLRERYWPHMRRALSPLVEAGIEIIHHCDGNVMPIVDDMLGAGFTGFQGFQYECGVDPYALRQRRTLSGQVPFIMGGLSVTRTLPYGAPEDVVADVEYALDYTEGGERFLLFTSNAAGIEVPPANLLAGYQHLAQFDPEQPRTGARIKEWPWAKSRSRNL